MYTYQQQQPKKKKKKKMTVNVRNKCIKDSFNNLQWKVASCPPSLTYQKNSEMIDWDGQKQCPSTLTVGLGKHGITPSRPNFQPDQLYM